MKTKRIFAVILIMVATTASAFQTGNDLYEAAITKNSMLKSGQVIGFIDGVIQGMFIGYERGMAGPGKVLPNDTIKAGMGVCMSPDVTSGQTRDVVVKFLADHPDGRHFDASLLVWSALKEAFPCRH